MTPRGLAVDAVHLDTGHARIEARSRAGGKAFARLDTACLEPGSVLRDCAAMSIRRRALAAAVLLCWPLGASASADCRTEDADCTLRETAAQVGVRIGAAVREVGFGDPRYASALAADFDSVTHEHAFKWDAVQPARGDFRFEAADRLVAFAEANGMAVRGHTLVWEQALVDSTPGWVTAITDPAELRTVLAEHISTLVGRYRGRVGAWDVVNEPLETAGPVVYENHFHRVLGPGYLAEAFALAHAADPDATLFLNEVLVSAAGPKFDALLALLRDLRRQGVPVHGVGIQGHFFPPVRPAELQANLEALAALDVVVELTEVDVLLRAGADQAARLAAQGHEYFGLAAACRAVPACRRITMWGFTDRYTWIDDFIGPGLAPLPLDVDYQRKPAWFGLRDGLLSRTDAVTGRELVIRVDSGRPDRRRLRVRSRDAVAVPAPGSTGDPTVHGGALVVSSATSTEAWNLPAAGWRRLAAGRGYEYADRGRVAGPVRRVRVRDGRRIEAVVAGEGLDIRLDADPTPLDVSLDLGNASWCMRFAHALRFRPRRTLRAAYATAPARCPAPGSLGE
jgi:endo-1,4-beta-xylanase